jgi:SAM-dependent methyltransferase
MNIAIEPERLTLDCICCRSIGSSTFLYMKNQVPIYKCSVCGVGKSLADDFDADEFYDESYFNGSRPDGYADYMSTRDVLQEHFRQELDHLMKFGVTSGKLIDLGCAYGYFLDVARDRFDVWGLELCEEAVVSCHERGLGNVVRGDISVENLAGMPEADAIVMFDVIEHLPEPAQALVDIAAKMKPGALLTITTGDFSSAVAKMMGQHWRLMTPPQHLWFFTPKSLKLLGEAAGLELIELDHPWKKVPLGLMAYQALRYLSYTPRLPAWMHNTGLPVNLFDAMRAVFRKA